MQSTELEVLAIALGAALMVAALLATKQTRAARKWPKVTARVAEWQRLDAHFNEAYGDIVTTEGPFSAPPVYPTQVVYDAYGVPYTATLVLMHPPSLTISLYFNPEAPNDYRADPASFSTALWLASVAIGTAAIGLALG